MRSISLTQHSRSAPAATFCPGCLGCVTVASVLPLSLAARSGLVAMAGSRSLPSDGAALVARVASALVQSGRLLTVGCCLGADAAVLSAVPPASVHVFAAWGPDGAGAWRGSTVSAVLAQAAARASVTWWAGGGPKVPLAARLSARTRVVVSQASAGLVAFLSAPVSRGTTLACHVAVSRGLPVLAFPLGFAPMSLSSLGAGLWVPAGGSDVWRGAWLWAPDQGKLF